MDGCCSTIMASEKVQYFRFVWGYISGHKYNYTCLISMKTITPFKMCVGRIFLLKKISCIVSLYLPSYYQTMSFITKRQIYCPRTHSPQLVRQWIPFAAAVVSANFVHVLQQILRSSLIGDINSQYCCALTCHPDRVAKRLVWSILSSITLYKWLLLC